MTILPNGALFFDNLGELTYNLLNTIGLSINSSGYVYDQDTKIVIQDAGRVIKASVDDNLPCYAGQGEVVLDVLGNIRLMTTLFGYAMDKATAYNEFSSISQYIEDLPGTKSTALCIKMTDGSVRQSRFYNNKCLKYVDAIFAIDDTMVDLSNFDSLE